MNHRPLFLVVVLLLPGSLAAADCSEKLLQPDILSTRSDIWFKAHIATYYTRDAFEKRNRDLIASGGGFLFDYSDALEAREQVKLSMTRSLELQESQTYFKLTGNAAGYAAYIQCKTLDPMLPDLSLGILGRPDETEFLIRVNWRPSNSDPGQLKGVTVKVIGGKVIDKLPTSLNAGETTFSVSRARKDVDLKVYVNGVRNVGNFTDQLLIAPYFDVKPTIKFPAFVSPASVFDCKTRGGRCAWEGSSVRLAGTLHTNGVVYTQTYGGNQTALASFPVIQGADRFVFTVGNYWTGGDCGGQADMNAAVYVDGQLKWSGQVSRWFVHSLAIDLSASAKMIQLRGESVDQDERCDDMAWGSLRFEQTTGAMRRALF